MHTWVKQSYKICELIVLKVIEHTLSTWTDMGPDIKELARCRDWQLDNNYKISLNCMQIVKKTWVSLII